MSAPPTWNEAVPPGTVLLGKYRVDSILGKGGMGIVAEATHLALGEKVAIKLLRPDVIADDEACSRFLREAQAAVRLKSEHVARVSDVGTLENGSPYLVMEFLEGVDLDQMLTSSGVVAPGLAVDLVLQACEALAEAHAHGIVHRDVKPGNVFVTWRADGTPLVKVLDFGISKAPVGVDLALTRTQSVLGTPAYMSPEQMRSARTVDARTDLWSLGTVLYELIEGHRPFEAESFSEMCVMVAADPPTPMACPELPAGLEAVIARCLEKDPAKRPQSVAELAAALEPFARDAEAAKMYVERTRRTLERPRSRNDELPGLASLSMLRVRANATPAPAPIAEPVDEPVRPRASARIGVRVGVAVGVLTVAIAAAVVATNNGGDGARAASGAASASAAAVAPEPAPVPAPAPTPPPAPAPLPVPPPPPVMADAIGGPEPAHHDQLLEDMEGVRKKERAKAHHHAAPPPPHKAADNVFGKRK